VGVTGVGGAKFEPQSPTHRLRCQSNAAGFSSTACKLTDGTTVISYRGTDSLGGMHWCRICNAARPTNPCHFREGGNPDFLRHRWCRVGPQPKAKLRFMTHALHFAFDCASIRNACTLRNLDTHLRGCDRGWWGEGGAGIPTHSFFNISCHPAVFWLARADMEF
jgi:hypothetical protein